jgi:sugar phosphate isomerase/epimerase
MTAHRDPVPGSRVRAIIDAAADAGFSGVSIWTEHCDFAAADDMTAEEYYDYHRERGLSVPSAEVIMAGWDGWAGWATTDRAQVEEVGGHILDVSAGAGAEHVITVWIGLDPLPFDEAVAGLRTLCDLAADRGLKITYEFLPFTGVPTIGDAVRLVEATDRENLGFVLDTWHWFHQPPGPHLETLLAIPPERIHLFQFNDAPAKTEQDAMTMMVNSMFRLLPGEGTIDYGELIGAIDSMGADPVVISEVFSAERLAQLEPAENARLQYAALTDVLARATTAA